MFSEGVNHRVGLIMFCFRCITIVVVEVGQPTIVMLLKPFILILWGCSVAVGNGPLLGDALELFSLMLHTEGT